MSGVGGKVRLITGESFGAGKSYHAVREADLIVEKGSPYVKIYSNIRAHAELGNGITDLPKDWRDCDDYSLLIIDEVQFNEKFSKHFSSRRDSEIVDFTQIRHKHLDVWMITPSTKLMNADIRELVSEHHYITVASKTVSKCYVFKRAQTSINDRLLKQALDTYTFKIEEKYWKLYKSTEDGQASDRQTHFNMNLVTSIIGALFTLGLIIGFMFYLFGENKSNYDKLTTDANGNKVEPNVSATPNNNANTDLLTRIRECQKSFGWTAEMCRDAIDQKSHELRTGELAATTGNTMNAVVAKYNPNKPYDVELPEVPLQVNDYPRMSGVITQKNGKLIAVNQYGDYMPDVSQEDCKRYLNGYRPFDYSGAKKSISQAEPGLNKTTQINDLTI